MRPLPRGELRLHQHRVSDADRHAGHRRRLPADRDGEDRRPASTRARSSRSSSIALIVSWFVAVDRDSLPRLPDAAGFRAAAAPSPAARAWARLRGQPAPPAPGRGADVDPEAVYRDAVLSAPARAGRVGRGATAHVVIVATLAASSPRRSRCSGFVPQQFFPASSRPELLVDLRLPEGSVVRGDARRGEAARGDPRRRAGRRELRGVRRQRQPALLPAARPAAAAVELRAVRRPRDRQRRRASALRTRLQRALDADFPALRGRVSRLENGPPVGFPLQFRVSGEDIPKVRAIAREVAAVMRADPTPTTCSSTGTSRPRWSASTSTRTRRACWASRRRTSPPSSTTRCRASPSPSYRERRQADRRGRRAARRQERAALSSSRTSPSPSQNGKAVPITQIADIRYEQEERHRLAAQPAADDHRARRRQRRRAGARRHERDRPAARPVRARPAARLPDRDRRRDRGFAAGPAVDRRRRAAVRLVGC